MRKIIIAIFALLVGATGTYTGMAQDSEPVMLRAMKDELQRNIKRLSLEGVSAPFFISYQVKDLRTVSIQAVAGAVTIFDTSRSRRHAVRVLVGDHKQTQEHFFSSDLGFSYEDYAASMPLEDDYDAIRRELWLSTDRSYKKQTEALEKKRAALRQQQTPEEYKDVADFASATPVVSLEEESAVACDVGAWKERVRTLSALFKQTPDIYTSNLQFSFHRMMVYFVNSEGTVVMVPRTLATIVATAGTQAEDGEPLMDFVFHEAVTPDGLPDVATLETELRGMTTRLLERRSTVAMDGSYTGPVLFEDQAVAELVMRIYLGDEGLIASRMPVLEGMMSMMASQMQKRNLRDKVGKRVLPQEWTIASTPAVKDFEGRQLTGAFGIDAEGVRPTGKLLLVDAGNVASLITDRTPTPGFPASTGHRSLGIMGDDGLSPGVLDVTVSDGPASSEMKKLLFERATEEGLEHAYIVRRIRPDAVAAPSMDDDLMASFSMFGMEGGGGSTKFGDAIQIVRVNIADGKEIPIRSVEILKPGASALRKMTACTARQAWNGLLEGQSAIPGLGAIFSFSRSIGGVAGGVPVSMIVPGAVLVDDMEVRKEKRPITMKPPIVQSPLVR